VARFATLRPDQHDQAVVEVTRADETRLAVVEPIVDDRRGATVEDLAGPREIETAMPARQLPFGWIESDIQLNVPPIIVKRAGVFCCAGRQPLRAPQVRGSVRISFSRFPVQIEPKTGHKAASVTFSLTNSPFFSYKISSRSF
jgi:hypothetical protein